MRSCCNAIAAIGLSPDAHERIRIRLERPRCRASNLCKHVIFGLCASAGAPPQKCRIRSARDRYRERSRRGKAPHRSQRKRDPRATQGFFALGTTDHRPHRLQKRETPGGKLKMMKAFPPGAISHPAARRETLAMLRRRKDGCQRNKFCINISRAAPDVRFGIGAARKRRDEFAGAGVLLREPVAVFERLQFRR
jgi:hypothetical protein